MKWLIIILSLCSLSSATTRYIAQTAGTFTGGTACNGHTAVTVATFNATTLTAGDIAWVCGQISLTGTGGVNGITPNNGGSSGNPVVINFDTGGVIQAPSCGTFSTNPTGGCIDITVQWVTVNGMGVGVIQNYANGTVGSNLGTATCLGVGGGGTPCTLNNPTAGVYVGASNVVVENLTIANMFVRIPCNSATNEANSFGVDVDDSAASASTNVTVTGNTIHDALNGVVFVGGSTAMSNMTVTKNTISHNSAAIVVAEGGGGGTISNTTISFNDIFDAYYWWDTTDSDHLNGMHLFAAVTGTAMNGVVVNGNYVHGNFGGSTCGGGGSHTTAMIFIETTGGGTASGVKVFNNVIVTGLNDDPSDGMLGIGDGNDSSPVIVNNTFVANATSGPNNAQPILVTATGLTIENNIEVNALYGVYLNGTGTNQVTLSDHNDFFNVTNFRYGGSIVSFSTWKSNGAAFDPHSITTDPKLNSTAPPYSLQTSSPAIGLGANLTSLAISGLSTSAPLSFGASYACGVYCVGRPSTGAWDAGAYEHSVNVNTSTIFGTGVGSGVTILGPPSGPRSFSAYSGQDPIPPTSFPNWGGQTNNGLVFSDPSYPSGTAASVRRCVDGNTLSDHLNFVILAGRGGASQGTIYTERQSNFTILETNGGTVFAIQLNPANGSCTTNVIKQNYSSICPSHSGNNVCSATSTLNFNSPFWSQKTNGTLFAQGSTDSVDNTTVLKYTINTPNSQPNTCAGGATVGCYSYTTIAHLINGLPYAVATAWAPTTTYPFGTYITAAPAAVTWTANDPNLALGDIVNIPSCSYFKVTVVGTTGGSAPNWAAHCTAANSLTDGTVTWRALGSNAFLFQCVTSPSCISGSSQPTFLNGVATTEMPNGHPDMATITADATGNWQNSGLQNVTVWTEFGGMGLNENLITWGASNNTYGQAANNRYAVYNGDQNTASFAMVYNISANTFRLFNTQTNMITQTVCTGGTGVDCTGGSFTWSTLGQVNAPCFATMHEISNTTGTIATVGNLFLSGSPCNVGKRYWNETQAVFNATTVAPISPWNVNHWTTSNNYSFNWNSNGWMDSTHGIWGTYSLLSQQALNPPAVLVIGSTNCKTVAPFTFPPCSGSAHIDTHTDSAYNPDGDFDPVMGTGFATDGVSDNLSPDMAWQGEFIVVQTSQSTTSPGAAAVGKVWREGHVCGWGTSPTFSQNQCISHNSTDGQFAFVSSDCQGTCGSTAGSPPTCCGTGANQIAVAYVPAFGDPATITCIGGRTWLPGNAYVVGNIIQPENSYSNGTAFNAFQVTACSGTCTSGTTKPAFGTVPTTGQTIVDNPGANQVVWTNVNNGNCMGTVLMLTLN